MLLRQVPEGARIVVDMKDGELAVEVEEPEKPEAKEEEAAKA